MARSLALSAALLLVLATCASAQDRFVPPPNPGPQPIPLAYVPISGNSGHAFILYGYNGTVDNTQIWAGAEVFCQSYASGSLASVTGTPQRKALMALDSWLNYNLTINGTTANGTACSWFGYNVFHGENGQGSFTDGGNIKHLTGTPINDTRAFNVLAWCGAVCGGQLYRRDCDVEANAFICKTKAPPPSLNASGVVRLATINGDEEEDDKSKNGTLLSGAIARECGGNNSAALEVLASFATCFNPPPRNGTNTTINATLPAIINGTLTNVTVPVAVNAQGKVTLLPGSGPEFGADLNAQWNALTRYAEDLTGCPSIFSLFGAPAPKNPVPSPSPVPSPAYGGNVTAPPPGPCNCFNRTRAVERLMAALRSCPGILASNSGKTEAAVAEGPRSSPSPVPSPRDASNLPSPVVVQPPIIPPNTLQNGRININMEVENKTSNGNGNGNGNGQINGNANPNAGKTPTLCPCPAPIRPPVVPPPPVYPPVYGSTATPRNATANATVWGWVNKDGVCQCNGVMPKTTSVPTPTLGGLVQCARFRGSTYCATNRSLAFSWADGEVMCEVSSKNAGLATIEDEEVFRWMRATFGVNGSFPGYWLAGAKAGNSTPWFFGASSTWLQNQTIMAANASQAAVVTDSYLNNVTVSNCANGRGCGIAMVFNASSGTAALQYVDASFALPVICKDGNGGSFTPRVYGSAPMPRPASTPREDGKPIIKVPARVSLVLTSAACAAIAGNSTPFEYSFANATATGWNTNVASALRVLQGDIKFKKLDIKCARRRGLLQAQSTVSVQAEIETPPGTSTDQANAAGSVFSSQGNSVYGSGQFAADFSIADVTLATDSAVTQETTSDEETNIALIVGLAAGLGGAALIAVVVVVVLVVKKKKASTIHPEGNA